MILADDIGQAAWPQTVRQGARRFGTNSLRFKQVAHSATIDAQHEGEHMEAVDHTQQGPTSGLTPHVTVGDAAGAIEFYKAAFAAEELMRMPGQDGKRLIHAHLKINGASLLINDDFPEFRDGVAALPPAAITLHLQVDDADAWANRAIAAGATLTMPMADMFWGDRYGQIKDPFGVTWSLGSTPTP